MTTTDEKPKTPEDVLLEEDVSADTMMAGLRKKMWNDVAALAARSKHLAERCEKAAQAYAGAAADPEKRMNMLTAEKSLGRQAVRMLYAAELLAGIASDDANGRLPMAAWHKKWGI